MDISRINFTAKPALKATFTVVPSFMYIVVVEEVVIEVEAEVAAVAAI